MSDYIQDQPPPADGHGADAWELVMKDMAERRRIGIERYGMPLRHDNGRDHLVDAYQEALDLAVYLRAEIERRKAREDVVIRSEIIEILKPVMYRIKAWSWTPSEKTARVVDHHGRVWCGTGESYQASLQQAVDRLTADFTRNA